jgi:hypothetical protein
MWGMAQYNGCSTTTNAHSETGQMAVCCQSLTLGALSSRSALSVLVGALFKKFILFLNKPCSTNYMLSDVSSVGIVMNLCKINY